MIGPCTTYARNTPQNFSQPPSFPDKCDYGKLYQDGTSLHLEPSDTWQTLYEVGNENFKITINLNESRLDSQDITIKKFDLELTTCSIYRHADFKIPYYYIKSKKK